MILFLLALMAVSNHQSDPPSSLLALEQNRNSIASGRIAWSVLLPRDDGYRELAFVSTYAKNGDTMFERRGDPEGWVEFDRAGAGVDRFPKLYLRTGNKFWFHAETGASAQVWDQASDLFPHRGEPGFNACPPMTAWRDPRAAGAYFGDITMASGFSPVWQDRSDQNITWTERFEGGFFLVTRTNEDGSVISWMIDPQRGFNAVRVSRSHPQLGELEVAESTLREFDGVWLPETCKYYAGGTLQSIFTINRAALNRPDDPAELSPASLGMEPGVNVIASRGETQIWDGQKPVASDEWRTALRHGNARPGPNIQRMYDGLPHPLNTPSQLADRERIIAEATKQLALGQPQMGAWERYVHGFITRHRLNPEQTERAWSIYRQCREKADQYVARNRDELLKTADALSAARKERHFDKIQALRERQRVQHEPLERIFEHELKPRLQKLPTRAQHDTAGASQPASRPAGQPTTADDSR